MTDSDLVVLVLAAGEGRRFGTPKQFVEFRPGERLVDAAVSEASKVSDRVIVALPPNSKWDGPSVEASVAGRPTRVGSTAAALSSLASIPEVVVVHDAAHPLASAELMQSLVRSIARGEAEAVVPILPLVDVVKRVSDDGRLETVGRDGLVIAQAPMAFAGPFLARAVASPDAATAWEDSMLVETIGGRVVGVPGSRRNIHVVTEDDLRMARALAGA